MINEAVFIENEWTPIQNLDKTTSEETNTLCLENTGYVGRKYKDDDFEENDKMEFCDPLNNTLDIQNGAFDLYTDSKIEVHESVVNINDIKAESLSCNDNTVDDTHELASKNTGINDVGDKYICCKKCSMNYEGYNFKSQVLVHILDNSVSIKIDNRPEKTIPKDILAIRELSGQLNIFALKQIPKGVAFGPFRELKSTFNDNRCVWALKCGKFVVNPEKLNSSNWMQFVNSTTNASAQNLSVFVFEDKLYYQSTRAIKKDEELLVYFGDEYANNISEDKESYASFPIEHEARIVYACTYCCLGFKLAKYLANHKVMCPSRLKLNIPLQVSELIQCPYCNIYLEEREYLDYHISYCYEMNPRPRIVNGRKQKIHIKPSTPGTLNVKGQCESKYQNKYKCPDCNYCSKYKQSILQHSYLHNPNSKPFKCDNCGKMFSVKHRLREHQLHCVRRVEYEEFECTKCSYKCNNETQFRVHLRKHVDDKPFQCELCCVRFTNRSNLRYHLRNKHGSQTKRYKCEKCKYQTNRMCDLKNHEKKQHTDKKIKEEEEDV